MMNIKIMFKTGIIKAWLKLLSNNIFIIYINIIILLLMQIKYKSLLNKKIAFVIINNKNSEVSKVVFINVLDN